MTPSNIIIESMCRGFKFLVNFEVVVLLQKVLSKPGNVVNVRKNSSEKATGFSFVNK